MELYEQIDPSIWKVLGPFAATVAISICIGLGVNAVSKWLDKRSKDQAAELRADFNKHFHEQEEELDRVKLRVQKLENGNREARKTLWQCLHLEMSETVRTAINKALEVLG